MIFIILAHLLIFPIRLITHRLMGLIIHRLID